MSKIRILNSWRIRQFILISISASALIVIYMHLFKGMSVKTLLHQGAAMSVGTDILLARDKLRRIESVMSKTGDIKMYDGDKISSFGKEYVRNDVMKNYFKPDNFLQAQNNLENAEVPVDKTRNINSKAINLIKRPENEKVEQKEESKEAASLNTVEAAVLPKDQVMDDSMSSMISPESNMLFDKQAVPRQKDIGNRTAGHFDVDPWLKMTHIASELVYNKTGTINQKSGIKKRNEIPKPSDRQISHLTVQGVRNSSSQRRIPLNLTKEVFIFEVMRESKEERRSVKDNKCVLLKSYFVESPICVHDPIEDEVISATLLKQQTWEPNLLYVTGRILTNNPELKYLDLGCNLGVYTIVAAKLGIDVVAVDPNKQNLRLLTKALSLGGLRNKVIMLWNAVSNKHENVTLTDIVGNVGGSYVESVDGIQTDKASLVQTVCIDDLVPFFKSSSVFIKIDIETYEWKALQGAKKFFKEVDVAYVLMEWSYHKEHGDGPEIIDFMFSRGLYPHINANFNTQLEKETYETWPDNVLWIKYSNILVE